MDCPKCGRNLALVGKVHKCSPGECISAKVERNSFGEIIPPSYRKNRIADVEKRRKYMREYMKRRRGLEVSK